jgi:hypothetical protein
MRFFFIIFILALIFTSCKQGQPECKLFWQDGYCRQENVMPIKSGDRLIKVRTLEEGWQVFETVDLPESFLEWNANRRLEFLQDIRNVMSKEGSGPRLAGPHNGIVATTGYKRYDAQFSLNNAVKGMGFLPKPEKIEEMIALLDSTELLPMPKKLAVLEGFYSNLTENFDLDKQISLELYSQPEFMTQTFLNQVYNPISTVVFLDIPSYKLKTIARLLDPNDINLSTYEKQVVSWINKIHNYFHGPFSVDFIGVIYFVIEVYDNSPRGKDAETGMGRKIIPLLP